MNQVGGLLKWNSCYARGNMAAEAVNPKCAFQRRALNPTAKPIIIHETLTFKQKALIKP